MIKTKESSHFYSLDGQPRYEVLARNGAMRPATLADARKNNWLPSVTTISKLWPADGLRNWLREQDILAAITTPRLPGDTDESFIKSVLLSADEEAARAAEKGTRRHGICEAFHNQAGPDWLVDYQQEDLRFCQPYIDWFNENVEQVINSEFVVVHQQLGYAGRVDLHCRLKDGRTAIIDLKNRKKPAVFPQDGIQLAAYCETFRSSGPVPHGISIVLGTTEPSILIKEWDMEEHLHAFDNFNLCREMWFRSKNYRPTL